jgi:hypothetical protein
MGVYNLVKPQLQKRAAAAESPSGLSGRVS